MNRITVQDRTGTLTELDVREGVPLMEALRDYGFGVEAVCGGCCSCATCHVWVDQGLFGGPGDIETSLLEASAHYDPERSRLSCQLKVGPAQRGTIVVVVPED